MNQALRGNNMKLSPRKLSIESLESRTVLAANVVATVVDGDLEITYEKAGLYDNDTEIRVIDDSSGGVIVEGLNGTKINGVAGGSFVAGAVADALVDLDSGVDSIKFQTSNLSGNVEVFGSGASNTIVISVIESQFAGKRAAVPWLNSG